MTLVVGIQCTDGIVLAADSCAIPGTGVVDVTEDVKKIHQIDHRFLAAIGGYSGQGHRFLEALRRLKIEDTSLQPWFDTQEKILSVMEPLFDSVCRAAKNARDISGNDGPAYVLAEALVAYTGNDGACLTHVNLFGQCDRINETLYHVIGDGEKLAAPFLSYIKQHVWKHKRPSIATGIVSALWMFHFAHNSAGNYGPPWTVAILRSGSDGRAEIEFLDDDVLDTHHRSVEELEKAFGNLPEIFEDSGESKPPAPP